jgi:hypothetical protein
MHVRTASNMQYRLDFLNMQRLISINFRRIQLIPGGAGDDGDPSAVLFTGHLELLGHFQGL